MAAKEYQALVGRLREFICKAQARAALGVNRELVLLFWQIGAEVVKRRKSPGGGIRLMDRLSRDLRREFPRMKGLSTRNLKYMRAFAEAWPDEAFVRESASQVPWFHHCVLLDRVREESARSWHVRQSIAQGWSREELTYQIETGLFRRQERRPLPSSSKPLPARPAVTEQVLRDPFNFDFLNLSTEAHARDIKYGLLDRVRDFLIDLGAGFAFVGRQIHLEMGGEDCSLDLLFYHVKLRCFVVIELEQKAFQSEFLLRMERLLTAVDSLMRQPNDAPSLGIIFCRRQSRVTVEYVFRDGKKQLGVSTYQLTHSLPKRFRGSLPSIAELEAELRRLRQSL